MSIRVFIVDDHTIVRAGLAEIVGSARDLTVCGAAATPLELLEFLQRSACDVVVLDVSLGRESGFDVIPQVTRNHPDIRILMLSMYSEEEYAIRALRLGASGYLTKESAPDELLVAIRQVASGRRFISARVAEKMAQRYGDGDRLPHERLSARELEVFRLIAEGKRPIEIAEIFSISVKTVSTHRRRILDKMEMSSTAQLIRYAYDHGL